jgi:DNA-binding XRE family transcriptional regulator
MTNLIHIDGKPFVLVPMHEYRRLLNGGQTIISDLPEEILDQISAGQQHPIKILRKFRGVTQTALAEAAGISRPYLTEIETGKKTGSVATLQALAKALAVNIDLITPLS